MAHEHQIAIVDDDESVREAAMNLFRSMSLPAVAFASAQEFLASDVASTTSCLVLDVQMPGMSGIELQRHLATTGQRIPIVFVTAHPDQHVREEAMKSGAVCFLTKPFNEGDLLDGLKSSQSHQR
jgi:FixJ family two-component response regulator